MIARLRSGHPLIVDQRSAAGRVVVFLTTLAPTWNNWATQPTFVVLMLELQTYLDAQAADVEPQLVGAAWPGFWPADQYRDTATLFVQPFVGPAVSTGPDAENPADFQQREIRLAPATSRDGRAGWTLPSHLVRGGADSFQNVACVASLRLQRQDGTPELVHRAINVEPSEGRLPLITENQLRESLGNTEARIIRFADLQSQTIEAATFSWNETLFAILVVGLMCEQLLAYRASYHPSTRRP